MIIAQIAGYVALLALLTYGGNAACKWVLRWSATTTPPESGQKITLRAGRVIGILERVLIFVGLVASSWEILAGVVALKTVARYSDLDKQDKAVAAFRDLAHTGPWKQRHTAWGPFSTSSMAKVWRGRAASALSRRVKRVAVPICRNI